jgi:excisionase family DNA binding protein
MDVFATWLTVAEAAKYLRISRATLYVRIAEGVLRPRRIGGRVLLARADLDAAIAGAPAANAGRP